MSKDLNGLKPSGSEESSQCSETKRHGFRVWGSYQIRKRGLPNLPQVVKGGILLKPAAVQAFQVKTRNLHTLAEPNAFLSSADAHAAAAASASC